MGSPVSAQDVAVPAGRWRPPVSRGPVALSVAGKVAEAVTLLALAVIVPRVLGPADFGQFAVALTVVTLASVAMMLGGPTLMARYVPAAAPGERVALARALSTRLAIGRIAQLAALGVTAAVLVAVDPSAFPAGLTALVVLSLVLSVAATLLLQAGLGLGRTGAWSARYPLQNAVLVAGVAVLYPIAGVPGAVAAIAVSCAAALALGAACVGPLLRGGGAPVALPRGAMRFAVLQAAGGALVQVAHRGGVVAVALLAGSAVQTGHAALALGVALAATYAVAQVFTVSLPGLAKRAGEEREGLVSPSPGSRPALVSPDDSRTGRPGRGDGGEAALRRLAGVALAVLLPAALGGALALEDAVPAVFGDGYVGAIEAFAPALAMVVLAPVNALALQAAALRLRPEATLGSAVAGVAAFLATAILLVPPLGATGGAAAALAGAVAATLASIRLLPGAVGAGVGTASLGGAAVVLALTLVVT